LFLPVLPAAFNLILASAGAAQLFTNLHNFTATSGNLSTNGDGSAPVAQLISSSNTLYGTTYSGGNSGNGTVFRVNIDGTSFTNLHSFTATSGPYPSTNSDGANPFAGLILSGNNLYGTAIAGGGSGYGTVFRLNTDGTGFTNLHNFTVVSGGNSDGASPESRLTLSGNTLYGTADLGGGSGWGSIFKVTTDGTGFTNLHSFNGNGDGANPLAGLILSSNALYGTAQGGGIGVGINGSGAVFKVNTNGTGFTNLHSFTALTNGTNSDGFIIEAGLTLSGTNLYGAAYYGGSLGYGTLFKLNTDGTGFMNLHSLNGDSDGANPYGGLVSSGDTLYGTAVNGGSSGYGTVFSINTDGTRFSTLYNFTGGNDGYSVIAGLALLGNTLYGVTEQGGASGSGTVFRLFIPPQLTITRAAANVVLTWPTNDAVFTLQSTTNLVSLPSWTNVFPGPVIVNGRNSVTNPISGKMRYYRLSQ
jgi:uncharacterized repeat protein (TIGR03803 family)